MYDFQTKAWRSVEAWVKNLKSNAADFRIRQIIMDVKSSSTMELHMFECMTGID